MSVNHGYVQFVEITADTSEFERQLARARDAMYELQQTFFEPLGPLFRALVRVAHDFLWLVDGTATGVPPYGGRWSRWQMKPRRA